jgi:hypothetical protein
MNLVESIISYFKKKKQGEVVIAPEGVCGPCWGHQEYDNKFREIFKDDQIEVNAGSKNYNFIQDVVVNKIEGIKLKNTLKGKECPSCKLIQLA